MLKINELSRLYLGIQGENEARTLTIDMSAWIALYPNGSVTIWHKRNGESEPTATGAVYDSETQTVTWQPTSTDTYYDGEGEAEIRLTESEVIKKSKTVITGVSPAATLAGTTLGSDWQSYINAVDSLRAGAVVAQEAAEDAQEAAEDAKEAAEDAQEAAEDAQTAAETAQGKAEDAQTAAEAAAARAEHASKVMVPSGGTEGQRLAKKSGTDFDMEWKTDPYYTKPEGGIPASDIADGVIPDPEDLIDDTAGDGDTDKVWSADKSAEERTSLLSAIQQLPDVKSTVESSADLYLCDENGNVIAEFKDGHIVTKNFDSANGGLIADTVQSTADLYVCDANGNVIAEFANGHIKTKNFDSSATATGGILNRMNKQTDGVYAACRWHQPNLSSKQFCLLVSGDSHGDSTRVESMIEYLNSIDAFDACVMAGDISGNTFSDSISYYLMALASAQKPVITSLGNHDTVGATSDTDLWTKYGDCFQYADLASGEAVSGKCYYHKDFTDQKIRVIVLMQYDYTYEGELCFGQDQIDWFIDVLNDTPTDYGVIIVEHTNPSRYMTYNMDESVTSSTWVRSNYAPTVMSGDPVPDIVDAWINGTTLSQTYSYTFDNPPSDLEVSADFTSRGAGEFITYIGGHWHMNVLGTPTAYTDQPDFHVPANGMIHATQGDMPRREGTVSEDSFCALAVDRNKKTVKIFQLGAHWTKDAVNRQFFKYSYGS